MPFWAGSPFIYTTLKWKEIAGTFYEKELQKTNQKEFRVEKVLVRKSDKFMLNGKTKKVLLKALRSDTDFSNWKPFKNDVNAFYFTSRALFLLKILKFLSVLFVHVAKQLD